ncbi:MAG: signal peptide peptidase SppA [Alphaproteobacteria bacterium]|nr:signal peptide peptidase SppA [Alphaproteobacteria bacterium]
MGFIGRALKRFIYVLGFFSFLSLLLVIGSIVYRQYHEPKVSDHTVLSLDLQGPITDGPKRLPFLFLSRQLSTYDIVHTLDQAAKDPKIKGLLVRLGHASLGTSQVQDIRKALHRFRASGKFAFVHAAEFGDLSGGTLPYYLASAFDEIGLQPMGSFAFVGLGMELPFARKLLDTFEIIPRFAQREEFKGVLETFTREELSDPSRLALQSMLNNMMGQIVKDVALERELKEEDVRRLIQECPIFNAARVQEIGLVDHVTYLDQFAQYALKKAGAGATFLNFQEYALAKRKTPRDKDAKRIALIFAEGEITQGGAGPQGLFDERGITADVFQEIFEDIMEAPAGKKPAAIVLRIDSPGGAPSPSEAIWRLIQVAKEKKIPVVVSMGNTCASGGYWIASAADKIIAEPGTITGSIGVAGGKVVLEKLWERIGVKWETVTTGPNATNTSPHHDFTPEQWARFQESLDFTYGYFIKHVADGRRMSVEKAHTLAKGRVWSGEQALEAGLVDTLGDLDTAIDQAKKLAGLPPETPHRAVIYPRAAPWPALLMGGLTDIRASLNTLATLQTLTHPAARTLDTLIRPGTALKVQ